MTPHLPVPASAVEPWWRIPAPYLADRPPGLLPNTVNAFGLLPSRPTVGFALPYLQGRSMSLTPLAILLGSVRRWLISTACRFLQRRLCGSSPPCPIELGAWLQHKPPATTTSEGCSSPVLRRTFKGPRDRRRYRAQQAMVAMQLARAFHTTLVPRSRQRDS